MKNKNKFSSDNSDKINDESTSSDDDEKLSVCPAEKRATRKRTFSLPGPNVHLTYTKQLVYHERADMKKSSRNRHRSDSCGSKRKLIPIEGKSGEIRRGVSMPAFQFISEENTPIGSSDDDTLRGKTSFGCGDGSDNFTGLEDDLPIAT